MTGGDAPAPGAELGGRYRLEGLLGAGGMATVWRARDNRLGRSVAVKALSDTLAHDPSYVRRFAREARLAAGLSHPNVVRVLDYRAEEGERPFLVLELLEGGTLAQRLSAGERIDAERLARELLGALGHIHDHGVVHRDIKPANILVGPAGDAKLTDFGIAQPEDATRYTTTGMVIGTLDYLAPEITAGGEAGPRSDLYSLGIVLSRCDPPASLEPLVDALTQADPDDRPATAADALSLLPSREAATEPTVAGGADPREIEVPIGPRALLIGLTALALLVGGILLLGGGEEGSRTDQPAERVGDRGGEAGGGGGGGGNEEGSQPIESAPAAEPEPPSAPAGPPDCERLAVRYERIREQGKAAEKRASKEEKEAVKEAYEDRADRAKDRQKACEEGRKEAERDEDDDD